MSLSRSDLEFLSLYYYIKEGVLAREFSQEVQNEPLSYDPKLYDGRPRIDYKILDPNSSIFGKLASSKGRGFLSFQPEEKNPAQIYNTTTSGYVYTYNTPFFNQTFAMPTTREIDLIQVKDQNGDIMDRSWYQIDYSNCRIRYPAPATPSGVVASGITPTTIDYRFHLVSVVEGYPTDDALPELPIVAIYTDNEEEKGLQIGPGVEFEKVYYIDIFATSTSERRRILDTIKRGLVKKHAPVIDFNRTGQPLEYWGVINPKFIQDIDYQGNTYQSYLTLNPGNGSVLYFLNIETHYDVSPRNTMSKSMRHMGKIKVTTCTYTDRDPDLVGKFSGLNEPPGGFDSLVKKDYSA